MKSEVDASFYQLIHQLLSSQRERARSERRGRRRKRFQANQRIAPLRGSRFPDDSEFFTVRCYDLTRAGFSFFMSMRPDFTALVAEFGAPPNTIYVVAEVRRCSTVLVHRSGLVEHIEGRASHVSYQGPKGEYISPMILVGCRLVARLEKPAV